MTNEVVAVVPLVHDDRQAPGGCAGLRLLRGRSLVERAVAVLGRSSRVSRVVVPAPPAVVDAVRSGLSATAPDVSVLPVVDNAPGSRLLAALEAELCAEPSARPTIVVVHDPLHPLTPATLVDTLLAALDDAPDAAGVVPLGPVTDTVKWADEDDVITATVDREGLRIVHVPQAYRIGPLSAALRAAAPEVLRRLGPAALPDLMLAVGACLHTVPAPAETLRVADEDDLVLADALLT